MSNIEKLVKQLMRDIIADKFLGHKLNVYL